MPDLRTPSPRMALLELTTPRLRLRRWREEDEAEMAAINRDPEVARYLNRPTGAAAVAAFLRRPTGRPELGWRLARRAWGRGLAIEWEIVA